MLSFIRNTANRNSTAGWMYGDKIFFRSEMQSIFYKKWLFMGHTCDIPLKGHCKTVHVGEYPILLRRENDGIIHGFRDVYLDTGVSRTQPVAVETASGLIFASVAKDPPCFKETRKLVDRYLSPFDLENAKVVHESHVTENANWKLTWENNKNYYKWSHPVYYPKGNVEIESHEAESQNLRNPGQYIEVSKGDCKFVLNKVHSMGGGPTEMCSSDIGEVLFYHFPSVCAHFTSDYCLTFRISPISTTETKFVTTWLVRGDMVLGKDHCLNALAKVSLETNRRREESVEWMPPPRYPSIYLRHPWKEDVNDFLAWHHSVMAGQAQL
jgi:Rieske 2Fe-2S family protein